MMLTLLLALLLVGRRARPVRARRCLPRIQADENIGRIAAYGYNVGAGPTPARTPMLPKLAARLGESRHGSAEEGSG